MLSAYNQRLENAGFNKGSVTQLAYVFSSNVGSSHRFLGMQTSTQVSKNANKQPYIQTVANKHTFVTTYTTEYRTRILHFPAND